MKKNFIIVSAILMQLIIVTVSMGAGYFIKSFLDLRNTRFPILNEAYGILLSNAIADPPTSTSLEYGMIKGMLQVYNDPYTVFIEPPQHELQKDQLEGKYGGIGARLEKDQQKNWLIFPFKDSPAAKAGILEGDRLLQVDQFSITPDTSLDNIEAALRGPIAEKVKVTIGRAPDYSPLSVLVTRMENSLPSVTYNLAPSNSKVGVIQINIVAETTPSEVTTAIQDLEKRGALFFILDLRDNGGGLVETGVETAELFLRNGEVIHQQYRGKPEEIFRVKKSGIFSEVPLVVLVNHGTASASEIIAGALQNHERAKLIGTMTYGKDTIQLVFELSDKSSLHITAAHWWLPNQEVPSNWKGLRPDILVTEDQANSPAAIEVGIENLVH